MDFRDIYHTVDTNLLKNNYYEKEAEEKKKLIDKYLKEYAISKIIEIDDTKKDILKEEVTMNQLLEILSEIIPKEKHFSTIRHFTHYILNVAGNLQSFSIIWKVEESQELITDPIANFNIDGKWESITTHVDTTFLNTFEHVYNIFQKQFMVKNYRQLNKVLIQ